MGSGRRAAGQARRWRARPWDLNEVMAAEVMGEGEEHRAGRPARVPRQIKIIVFPSFLGPDSEPELVNSDKLPELAGMQMITCVHLTDQV